MLFAIHALDGADGLELRKLHQDKHMAFLKNAGDHGVSIVMSGPLVEDDGATMMGSLLIVDAEDRSQVEGFNNSDPYRKAGVWDRVAITAFVKRQG